MTEINFGELLKIRIPDRVMEEIKPSLTAAFIKIGGILILLFGYMIAGN